VGGIFQLAPTVEIIDFLVLSGAVQ